MDVTQLLRYAVEVGASDLHLKVGNVPFVRVDGELQPAPYPALSANDTVGAAVALMPEHKRREFDELEDEVAQEHDLEHEVAQEHDLEHEHGREGD